MRAVPALLCSACLALAACLDPATLAAGGDEGGGADTDADPGSCDPGPGPIAYAPPIMLAAGTRLRGVTLGDVDDDGDLDILTSAGDEEELLVFLGAGDGSFAAPVVTTLPAGAQPEALRGGAIADGVFDVVARASGDTLALVRMRGDGQGGFADQQLLEVVYPIFALGQLSDDAALDLLVPQSGRLRIYPGSVTDEGFDPEPIETLGPWTSPGAVGLADLDDDGDLDVALASSNALHVGLAQGGAAFEFAPPLAFFGHPSDLHTGDLDGDGALDIVVTTYGDGSDAGHVFRGLGAGAFAADELMDAPPSPACVDIEDLDGDGRDDVVMVGGGTLAAYLSTGAGFAEALEGDCAGQDPRQVSLGDLNGDCIEDAVTATDAGLCVMLSR